MFGLAGLIPFFAGALLPIAGASDGLGITAAALFLYGAVILSFLGGIAWGFAVRDGAAGYAHYGLSVVPALIAWASVLYGGRSGLMVLAASLVVWLAVERALWARSGLPSWYWRLRSVLTGGAAASLVTAALTGSR